MRLDPMPNNAKGVLLPSAVSELVVIEACLVSLHVTKSISHVFTYAEIISD